MLCGTDNILQNIPSSKSNLNNTVEHVLNNTVQFNNLQKSISAPGPNAKMA